MSDPTEQESETRSRRGAVGERYPIPSRVNAGILVIQLCLVASAFYLLRRVETGWQLALLALYFGVIMNAVYSLIHEAHHRILFRNKTFNDAAGIGLALLFPAPFHLLRQGHLGHHRRNRSDDEAFDLYFERDLKLWKYFAWYGILTGLYWLLVVASNLILLFFPKLMDPKWWKWDHTAEIFLEHFDRATFRIMKLEALGACFFHAALFTLLGVSWQSYCAMYFGFGLMWSSLQYVHHYQAERDVLTGAKNLHLAHPIDVFWMNHNWHQTHHRLPTVPWCFLPELAREQKTETKQLLGAYLQMWKGPQRAEEGVKNEFRGEVSRP